MPPRFSFSAAEGTIYAGFFAPFKVFGLSGTNCFAALGRDIDGGVSVIPPRPKHRPDRKSCLDNWWSISISLFPSVNSTPAASLCVPSTPYGLPLANLAYAQQFGANSRIMANVRTHCLLSESYSVHFCPLTTSTASPSHVLCFLYCGLRLSA